MALLDSYLDAFLSMPILLGLILQERQLFINKFVSPENPNNYSFSKIEIILATTFFAIIFEEGFPKWSPHFTKDYWDYIAYIGGALIFYGFINSTVPTALKQ